VNQLAATPTARPVAAVQQWQTVPVIDPVPASRLPLLLLFSYVVATFALFLLWPINWPIYYWNEWFRLIFYVTSCFLVLGGTMLGGSAGATRVVAPLPGLTMLLIAGALASTLLLVPSCLAYTGRPPWQVFDALGDQGAAYRRLQSQLLATSGQRNTIVIVRALLAPLTYAVVPLGILRWPTIGWAGRSALAISASCSVIFSVMRGTDKEIVDLFVIGSAAVLVRFGRSGLRGTTGGKLRRFWISGLAMILFLALAQGLFTQRKEERLGGYVSRTEVCANDSHICADLDNPWIAWLPLRQRFGLTFFILSTCSGYYGLDLALDKPFESTLGVGHSPAALSVYQALTDDPALHLRSFTYRNGDDHWSEDYYWSTLMTWIANDVGFPGAVAVIGLIGFLWGKWWREAAAGLSDPAAVLFALVTLTIFYLPANNQLLASYDGYTVLGAWVAIWLWHRRALGISAGVVVRGT
jgi:hypothetical protein